MIRRVETVAIKEHEVKRGEHDKRISAGQRHAVDKGLQQHLHDHLHDNDDEVQNEVQNGHHRGVPRDHAAQRPETVENRKPSAAAAKNRKQSRGRGRPIAEVTASASSAAARFGTSAVRRPVSQRVRKSVSRRSGSAA